MRPSIALGLVALYAAFLLARPNPTHDVAAIASAAETAAHRAVSVARAAASTVPEPATPTGGASLRFDVHFRDTLLTASDTELTLGDRFVLDDLVLSGGREVGHNGGVCTVTDVAASALVCVVTWALPDGTISTQFLNTPLPVKDFAVVGGTGSYAGARGTGQLIEAGDETGTIAFDLAP